MGVPQWLFWQMGGLGPMAGQNHHFGALRAGEDRLRDRPLRERDRAPLCGARPGLREHEFIAGDYSIADIASYPWVLPEPQGQNIDEFPNLKRWKAAIAARPAVVRAYAVAKSVSAAQVALDDAAPAHPLRTGQGQVR